MDIIARDRFSEQFLKAGAEAEKLSKKIDKSGSKIGHAVKVGAAVGAAALVTLAGVSVDLASKFEDSQKRLETAIKASGNNFLTYKPAIAAADKAMEKLGFTNTDTADALANLTVATKSPLKSIRELGLAADLARFKHISLADAATALGKAMAGNLKPIKALGIDLPVAAGGAVKVASAMAGVARAQAAYNKALAADKTKPTAANMDRLRSAADKLKAAHAKLNAAQTAGATILKTLADRLRGQAQTAAGTLAGKVNVLKARFTDMAIQLGTLLIPYLIKLVDKVSQVVTWMQRHQAIAKTLGIALVALTATFIALSIAMAIVELINPFSAMALGVVAATAGVIILYNRFAVARRIINDTGNAVKLWAQINIRAFQLVAAGARLLARGFLTFLLNPILRVFSAILHGAAIAFGFIPGLSGKLRTARDAFDRFRTNVNRILGGITSHKTFVLDAHVTQATRNAYAMYINTPSSRVFTTYFQTVKLPGGRVAGFASGGRPPVNTASLIGEHGPELFVPDTAGTIIPNNRLGGRGGAVYVIVNVAGSVIAERDLGDAVAKALERRSGRGGVLHVRTG
jgi:hypothetical protein